MKRLTVWLLALCMIIPVLPITTSAAEAIDSGTCGENLTWVLSDDGVLTISGTGDMYDYSFGETPWHGYADQIAKLEIGDQVTSIGDNAFYLFGALTEITIPCGVTKIGGYAFAWCYNLEEVILGANLKDIYNYAFYCCQSLTGLTIPKSVEYIGPMTFYECVNLTEIHFLGHVRDIYEDAFGGVTATAYYPANFLRWTEDTLLDYGGDLTWIPCQGVVEEIGRGQCGDNLSWILTDDGIMEISGTGDMYDYAEESPWQAYAYQIIQLKLGEGVTSIGARAFGFCYDLPEVTIHGGITSIGDRAFWGCYEMRNLTLCEGVQTIAEGAFMSCISLLRIDIPDSVESIGAQAFYGCSIPYSLEMAPGETLPLEEDTVDMLTTDVKLGLKEVYIGKGVSYIGLEAFANCQQLLSIRVDPENSWFSNDERGVLYDKEQTTLLQAPGGISGAYTIPETVTTVGDWAMSACPELTSVSIPGNVTKIGNYAFAAHSNLYFGYSTVLEEIRFLGNAPEFGVDAFWDIIAIVHYPSNKASWTEDVMQDYGGIITWVPMYAVVTEPTCQEGGYTTYTCANCGDSYVDDYTDPVDHRYEDGVCVWCGGEETLVKWYSGTTSLNGTIDLNIYVLLSDNLVNADDTYVRFTYAGKVVDVPMAKALHSPNEGNPNRYRFSCPIYAKQLADSVNVKFMKGEEMLGTELNYSVKQYCENQIRKSPDEKLVALCKALLNYGAAAQQLLNYNTGNLANASLSDDDKALLDVNASAYAYSVTGSEDGIKAKSATLMLEDVVKVRVYFTLTGDKSIEDYTITIDGKAVTPSYNEKGWYVETDGIPGKDLEKMFQVQVGGITVNYGALSFVNSKVGGSDVLESNISKALYAYWQAAEELLG